VAFGSEQPDTPCSAEALTRGVPRPITGAFISVCNVSAPPRALTLRR